ncbi:hypothetical protein T492DRAFT_349252 [Pavlovales sp. CCMP2436]|nr:hypothetical protein T492DRAFT_349252 [Pavlovales sp. CCMP2436]
MSAKALLALLRQWLTGRGSLFAIAAAVLVAYLFYRPPPVAGGERKGGRPARAKGRPRITVSTQGVLFARGSQLADGALDALRKLAEYADIYLIASPVSSDAMEAELRAVLAREGVSELPGFDPRKILFCSTAMGRAAMCRQIEPALHIDSTADIAATLAPHVPHVAVISDPPAAPSRENVLVATNMSELVDLYLASVRDFP